MYREREKEGDVSFINEALSECAHFNDDNDG